MDPAQISTSDAAIVPSLAGELAHVTEEMYKKNLELADRNKRFLSLGRY